MDSYERIAQAIVKANLSKELLKVLDGVFKDIINDIYDEWIVATESEWHKLRIELTIINKIKDKLLTAIDNGMVAEDELKYKEENNG
jgi:hypothetical protein